MKSGFNVNTDTKMLTIGNSMGYGKINLQRFISSTEVRQTLFTLLTCLNFYYGRANKESKFFLPICNPNFRKTTSNQIHISNYQIKTHSNFQIIYVVSVLFFVMLSCASVYYALWSTAGKGPPSWLSFVMSYCEVATFPLVSWVRCGA